MWSIIDHPSGEIRYRLEPLWKVRRNARKGRVFIIKLRHQRDVTSDSRKGLVTDRDALELSKNSKTG